MQNLVKHFLPNIAIYLITKQMHQMWIMLLRGGYIGNSENRYACALNMGYVYSGVRTKMLESSKNQEEPIAQNLLGVFCASMRRDIGVHDLLSSTSLSSSSSAVSVNHCNTRNDKPCARDTWGENTRSWESWDSLSRSRDTLVLACDTMFLSRDILFRSCDISASCCEMTSLFLPCASAARHILYTSDSFMSLGLRSGVLWK